jgi:hypothetical protein
MFSQKILIGSHSPSSGHLIRSFSSLAPSRCPTCPLWSSPIFLIIIKLLDSNLFLRSLVDKHRNEFTWQCSYCARDLIISPYASIEGEIVSVVVMSYHLLIRCWRTLMLAKSDDMQRWQEIFLRSCILNRFNILSIYAHCLNPIRLFDLSL